MVVVLIVTLVVQTHQQKKQLEAQEDQFNAQALAQADQFREQIAANEALLLRQIELERDEAAKRQIVQTRSRIMLALLDLERIATTGQDRSKFAAKRYEVLALNREVKSYVKQELREDYKRLADLQDRVAGILVNRVNAGIPTDDDFANQYGSLLGQVEEWTDAYVADDSAGIEKVNQLVKMSHASIDDAIGPDQPGSGGSAATWWQRNL